MTPNRSEEKSIALSNLTNYIAQEAYRASIIQVHIDEYNRIHLLFSEVKQRIKTELEQKLDAEEVEELTWLVIDHIVCGLPLEELLSDITHYLSKSDFDEEITSYFNSITQSCIEAASDLYKKHTNWNTNIHHRYPPSALAKPLVLLSTLEYITKKHYEASIQHDEEGNSIYCYINPPFSISPTVAKPVCYRFREHHSQEQAIPDNSLYKRININPDETKKLRFSNEQLEAFFALDFINTGIDSVSTINQLQLTIDLSNPISKRELEHMLFNLHNRIWHIQRSNSESSMLLAENLDQLEEAHNIPDLGEFNLSKHLDLTKSEVDGIKTLADAKNAVLGLIVWHKHFTTQKFNESQSLPVISYGRPEQNLDDSFDHVIDQIKQSKGGDNIRGYELSTLKKGYETISKAIQAQLIEQRAGRYQDRKLSPQRKEALLQSPDFNSDNLHPNDIEAVNTRIEKLNANQFDGLLKQHSDGSIWIIPKKRTT